MIPPLPSISTIIDGMTYAIRMAFGQARPEDMPPETKAIWDALWVRYILTLLSNLIVLESNHLTLFALMLPAALIDTLLYPVVSHFCLERTQYANRFPQFILAMTWIGNLSMIIMMTLIALFGNTDTTPVGFGGFLLVIAAIWMIWVTWSVATASLDNRKFLGVMMIVLMMIVQIINALIVFGIAHPL